MNYREIKLKFKKEYEETLEIFLSDINHFKDVTI